MPTEWMGTPVGLVWGVEAEVGDVGGVEAGKAFDLVREAAVLIPCLEQLAPHLVEALMVLLQQSAVPLPHLRHHLLLSHCAVSIACFCIAGKLRPTLLTWTDTRI